MREKKKDEEEEIRCPFCGHVLEKPYKHLIRKHRHPKSRNKYLAVYLCPECHREFTVEKRRKTQHYKDEEGEVDYKAALIPAWDEAEIFVIRKKDKQKHYIEHNILRKNGNIGHIGIKGIRGWKENKLQFQDDKAEYEFSEKSFGKQTQKWVRKPKRKD